MANDEPNTDKGSNDATPNRPDEYAIKYGRASNADLDTAADGYTPVMRRGGELADTDVMSADTGPDADPGDVPPEPTDTTIGENYSTGPRRTDPEEALLDPDYEAPISGDITQHTMGPDRAGHRVPPGLPGMPDQTGTLDQTMYPSQGDTLGTDTGPDSGASQP